MDLPFDWLMRQDHRFPVFVCSSALLNVHREV
jgi:hypothetical protein